MPVATKDDAYSIAPSVSINNVATYYNPHNHSHFSNNRFLDSMNSVIDLILQAKKKGLRGIGITEHGTLSSGVKVCKLMDEHPEWFNGDDGKPPFKVTLGEEIYLDDFGTIKHAVDNNEKTKFFHFVLTAKDRIGYHALRIISTLSWDARRDYHAFFFRGMRRLPTYKDELTRIMNSGTPDGYHFRGHVFASTACLGSELSQSILNGDKANAKKFIQYIEKTFGKENCFFEMMPADNAKGQVTVNKTLWNISHGGDYFDDDTGKGIPCIISTDSHYIDQNDRQDHSIFLKSENPDRDVKDFYYFSHLYTFDELKQYFDNDVLHKAAYNSLVMLNRIHNISLHHKQVIPKSPLPKVVKPVDLEAYGDKYGIDWNKYSYIPLFVNSKLKPDRYFMRLIFKGMHDRKQPFNDKTLSEINKELYALKALTEYFKAPMTQYFLTVRYAVIDTAWEADSLVGPGRGSVGEFYCAFLLHISEVNSIKWHLWSPRFISAERKDDMPDIDLDTESSRRLPIISRLKEKYGHDRVLNFSTFNTQASRSTIYTAARGLHINYIEAQNIANALPKDARGMGSISIHDALYGNKKKNIEPSRDFKTAVGRHPGMKNALLGIGGKIRGVSEHASGVAIFNKPYTYYNAMMRTNKAPGIEITQLSAHDSAYTSSLKYDILTLSALDRIHEAIRLLLRAGKITWQGTLYDTYQKYFGVQALDFTSPGMYKMLYDGVVTNAFEFSSIVGRDALTTVGATTFPQLIAANSLMRLTVDHGEQPIKKYVRYRDHPGDWDKDMKAYGLTDEERQILHEHLDRGYGVCYSQEALMKLSMDKRISSFDLIEANHLRKGVAKKDHKVFEHEHQHFMKKGLAQGTRQKFLDYIWNECAVPSKNYSFNLAHGTAYTIILIVEMNICYRFGPIFWQTACLSVNAGLYGDNFKNPDYNKLDRAMAGLDNIICPDINHSERGFVPYHNKILYGLYPISGLSAKEVEKILAVRNPKDPDHPHKRMYSPFKSFDDFIERTGFTKKTNLNLIKSGCFDNFNDYDNKLLGRVQLVAYYIAENVKPKKRLTTVQIPRLAQAHLVPDKYQKLVQLYAFRSMIEGKDKMPMNDMLRKDYLDHYADKVAPYSKMGQLSLLGGEQDNKPYYYDSNNHFHIDVISFEKYYQKAIEPLKNWLKTPVALKREADTRRKALADKYAEGNPEAWEMGTLGCYVHGHELSKTPIAQQYGITSDYGRVPKKPKVTAKFTSSYGRSKGQTIKLFKHYFIYGTVISKNQNKGLVYLLTPHGVANVYCGKWRYAIYNKKVTKKTAVRKGIAPKDSWFDRGTRLAILGYRQGSNFFANKAGAKDMVEQASHPGERIRKKYSECLYRIAGFGEQAHLVTISNHYKGGMNPLPTKNTKASVYPKVRVKQNKEIRRGDAPYDHKYTHAEAVAYSNSLDQIDRRCASILHNI